MSDKTANMPFRAELPITSVQLYIQSKKTYYNISWHPEKTKHVKDIEFVEDGNKVYVYCCDEVTMLNFFIMLVNEEKVDILVGWYSEQFDLPYIINRSRKLGVKIENISPTKNIFCSNEDFRKEETESTDDDGGVTKAKGRDK